MSASDMICSGVSNVSKMKEGSSGNNYLHDDQKKSIGVAQDTEIFGTRTLDDGIVLFGCFRIVFVVAYH